MISVLEVFLAHIDKSVSVARLFDEDCHCHDVVQAAARALENAIDLSKYLTCASKLFAILLP
jgi:hypothetical protein